MSKEVDVRRVGDFAALLQALDMELAYMAATGLQRMLYIGIGAGQVHGGCKRRFDILGFPCMCKDEKQWVDMLSSHILQPSEEWQMEDCGDTLDLSAQVTRHVFGLPGDDTALSRFPNPGDDMKTWLSAVKRCASTDAWNHAAHATAWFYAALSKRLAAWPAGVCVASFVVWLDEKKDGWGGAFNSFRGIFQAMRDAKHTHSEDCIVAVAPLSFTTQTLGVTYCVDEEVPLFQGPHLRFEEGAFGWESFDDDEDNPDHKEFERAKATWPRR